MELMANGNNLTLARARIILYACRNETLVFQHDSACAVCVIVSLTRNAFSTGSLHDLLNNDTILLEGEVILGLLRWASSTLESIWAQ